MVDRRWQIGCSVVSKQTAIWEAYADADLANSCPNCEAAPHTWCTRPDGRVRRTPCLARFETLVTTPLTNGGADQ